MANKQEPKKVFLNIVTQLRQMIEVDQLVAGDKLPSERELSERLQVGRSSVREALRALELLGLIETRRGEGTFLRDFRDHQLVTLLGTFILQEEQAQKDVFETKLSLEREAIRQTIERSSDEKLVNLRQIVVSPNFTDDLFFEEIMKLANNKLTLKIWYILKGYYYAVHEEITEYCPTSYLQLVDAIVERDYVKATHIYYKKIRSLTES